jgi:hypothetical protein
MSGTTRFTLDHKGRAVWVDLLALGGQSRIPGVICAGEEGGKVIGFPLSRIAGLVDVTAEELSDLLALFEKQDRISVEKEDSRIIIRILNWQKYQGSEVERARRYRERRRTVTVNVTGASRPTSRLSSQIEVEKEVEVEKYSRPSDDVNPADSRDGLPSKTKPDHLKTVNEVWAYYLQKLGKNPKLLEFTSVRKQKGLARLREALKKTGGDLAKAKGLLCLVIDNAAASEWHRGKYDSWEGNLFPSQDKFEWWLVRTDQEQRRAI